MEPLLSNLTSAFAELSLTAIVTLMVANLIIALLCGCVNFCMRLCEFVWGDD